MKLEFGVDYGIHIQPYQNQFHPYQSLTSLFACSSSVAATSATVALTRLPIGTGIRRGLPKKQDGFGGAGYAPRALIQVEYRSLRG